MKKKQDDKKSRKLYKIGHLTSRLGITPRTVRYYDQMGLLPHVKRSDGNVRLFDDEDIQIIKKIRRMQKEQYLPLDVIKEKLFGSEGAVDTGTVAVVTDSTAVLPSEMKDNLSIFVLPLTLVLKGKEFKDDGTISHQEFWKRNSKSDKKAHTYPPSTEDFVALYDDLYKRGFKRIYSVHLSSTLSDTYANAEKAAQIVSDRIDVLPVDSKSTGAGLGLFVLQIAEAIQKGESSAQIDIFISKQVPLIYYTTMINDMKHLSTRNSLGIVESDGQEPAIMEKLYSFKPVFTLRSKAGKDGEIDIIDCVKSKEEVHQIMLEHLEEEFMARGRYARYIMVTYNYLYAEAVELGNQIKLLCPNTPIFIEEGCIGLTAYLGPEMISVSIA